MTAKRPRRRAARAVQLMLPLTPAMAHSPDNDAPAAPASAAADGLHTLALAITSSRPRPCTQAPPPT